MAGNRAWRRWQRQAIRREEREMARVGKSAMDLFREMQADNVFLRAAQRETLVDSLAESAPTTRH